MRRKRSGGDRRGSWEGRYLEGTGGGHGKEEIWRGQKGVMGKKISGGDRRGSWEGSDQERCHGKVEIRTYV